MIARLAAALHCYIPEELAAVLGELGLSRLGDIPG